MEEQPTLKDSIASTPEPLSMASSLSVCACACVCVLLSLRPVFLRGGCVAEDSVILVCNPHCDQHGHAEQAAVGQHFTHHHHKACGRGGEGRGLVL